MSRPLAVGFVLLLVAAPARAEGTPAADFERDVLPVFREKCFSCHDAKKVRAGLRLDVRAAAVKGGESGKPGLVAGKPDASEIYTRVVATDDSRMPPKGDPLTPKQARALRDWIAAGAKWPDALANEGAKPKHWAFVPPTRPAVPEIRNPQPATRNPVDAFVLARLEKEGLRPAPEADRVTLIRRLSLDLTGLPPTPAEVDAFVADRSPDAYEKVVERLLGSPHYGERWGRLWLDAARYADSDGFEKDKPRSVYFYRDWVVAALNRDLPYDRFVQEQIAGDLLPGAGQDQHVATGFLRNSMVNEEGGIDPEQFRMEAMFDRMDAVGKAVLGLTVQCAQCHTHKYDPLTHAEYYRLFAFLNNAHESAAAVYSADEQMRRADVLRRVREVEADLKHRHPDWPAMLAAWEKTASGGQPAWTVVRPELDTSGGQKLLPQPDGSVLAAGYAPSKDTTALPVALPAGGVTGFRLEVLTDPSLPRGGPGRNVDGLFALTEFQATLEPTDKGGKPVTLKFARATSDAEAAEAPLDPRYHDKTDRKRVTGPSRFAVDDSNDTAWTVDVGPGRSNVPRKAVFALDKPLDLPAGGRVTVKLIQRHGGWNSNDNQTNNLGRFRLSVTAAPAPAADPLPAAVRAALAVPAGERTAAQADAVFGYWRTTVAEWKAANDAIEAAWKGHPKGTTQLVLAERERRNPRETFVLKRGDFLKPAEKVGPGVPAFLHPLPADAPPDRLGFARWLTDRQSPTTARAFVNRVWQAYFGTGLVSSPEDLGTQCEPPSHPELLDWLAVEFMEPATAAGKASGPRERAGADPIGDDPPGARDAPGHAEHRPAHAGRSPRPWSVKHLHRVIVTSATYRQASAVTPELASRDPANRLLARGPRFRADAEVVRDVALAASGLLSRKVGGPSVYPPIPRFLLEPPASYGTKTWPEAAGDDRYRRSLYVFGFRSVPYPALQAFDAPNGDFACVKRPRSNTPLQALVALNEPVFVEAAQALGRRALTVGGSTDADRLTYAFRLCVARKPTADELAVLTDLLAKQKERFARPDADAWAAAVSRPDDFRKLPNTATPADAAAWAAVGRALLNLDETMTKE